MVDTEEGEIVEPRLKAFTDYHAERLAWHNSPLTQSPDRWRAAKSAAEMILETAKNGESEQIQRHVVGFVLGLNIRVNCRYPNLRLTQRRQPTTLRQMSTPAFLVVNRKLACALAFSSCKLAIRSLVW